MAEINYNREEDILTLSTGKKVKHSMDVGDFIIDVDHDDLITGVEILNASENLNISIKKLAELKHAAMRVAYKPNHVYITFVMKFEDKEKDISIPLTVNLGHNKVQQAQFASV